MIGTTYHRSYTNYFVIVHKWNTNHFDHSQGLQITGTKNGVKDCIFILPSWKQDSPIHPLSQPVSISFPCFDPPAASAQARFTVTTPHLPQTNGRTPRYSNHESRAGVGREEKCLEFPSLCGGWWVLWGCDHSHSGNGSTPGSMSFPRREFSPFELLKVNTRPQWKGSCLPRTSSSVWS